MAKAIQLNVVDLGGGTAKGCDCEAPDLSAYAKVEDVPTKVSELENDSGYLTAIPLLKEKGEVGWQYTSEMTSISVNLSEYNRCLLKIGMSFHSGTTTEAGRNVNFINTEGTLLGTISGFTHNDPYNTSNIPYEVYVTCEKIAEDVYRIEVSGLNQHFVVYSPTPIGYLMGGVYSETASTIEMVTVFGYGKILIYA